MAERRSGWRSGFDRTQILVATAILVTLSTVALVAPDRLTGDGSETILLVAGATIGLPHGFSDFVRAHDTLPPSLGRTWLPLFVAVYMALSGLVFAGWLWAPMTTLALFLVVSAIHFGREDLGPAERDRFGLALFVRATTPIGPIVALHPATVAPYFAALSGSNTVAVERLIVSLQPVVLTFWAPALLALVARRVLAYAGGVRAIAGREALELSALAVAASVLPPLLTFAVYFCILHAGRHMADLVEARHPGDGRRALRMAALVLVPSAVICFATLAATWSGLAGPLSSDAVVVLAFRLVAALTVPHMVFDAVTTRLARSPPDTPLSAASRVTA